MKRKSRLYHHGDLKSAMVQAALELVRKKGPRGFTLNEASRIAGVSVSAPYNHFKDKEGLLIEIVVLGNRTLEMDLRAAAAMAVTAEAALIEVFLAYIQFARQHPDLFAVMFQSGINKDKYPEVHASAAAAFGIARELAAQLERTPAAAQQLTLAIWTMAHGFAALEAERALTQVGGTDAGTSARALVGRLLHAELYARS